MKKVSLVALAALSLSWGCVSDEENAQIIFERDLEKINEYVTQNSISSVKELVDTGTGIRIYWTEVSESDTTPEVGDTISVNYTAKFLDNVVFDTSIESVARANGIYVSTRDYEPYRYPIGYGYTIPGFEFGIMKMELGDKATVIMPSLYGYGTQGSGSIPKNSPLVFEVELVEVKKIVVEDL